MNPWELTTYWESSDIEFDSFLNESFSNDELLNTIYEASQTATKKNFLQTIWGIIKKGFALLVAGIKKLINGIKNFFTGKKQITSADDIVSQHVKPKKIESQGKNNKIPVDIPADPKSEVQPPKFDAIVKNLSVKFNTNGSITLSPLQLNYNNGMVPNQNEINNAAEHAARALYCIKNPHIFSSITTVLDSIIDLAKMLPDAKAGIGTRLQNQAAIRKMTDAIVNNTGNWVNNIKDGEYSPTTVTLVEFTNFSKNLSGIYDKIISIDDTFDISKFNSIDHTNLARSLNTIGSKVMSINFGMNALSTAIQDVYQVDARYHSSIKNIKDLAEITSKMIKGGIPSKYIMWNIFFISDPSLYGNENRNFPKWGQSRVVFIPKGNKYVYKIALNPEGLRSNNNELRIYNDLSKKGLNDVFCKTWCDSGNPAIINAELIKETLTAANGFFGHLQAPAYADEVNTAIKQAGLNYEIIDLHGGNFGINNRGKVVATDYGAFRHT